MSPPGLQVALQLSAEFPPMRRGINWVKQTRQPLTGHMNTRPAYNVLQLSQKSGPG